MQVVLVCNHLDQVYGHHDSQDHTCKMCIRDRYKAGAPLHAAVKAIPAPIRIACLLYTSYARQSGGKGQYGHVKINIEPNPNKGYEFVNNIVGGAIPGGPPLGGGEVLS